MLCENCGKRQANVRYTESINGITKEINLCEECSRKLGITNSMDMDVFSMDIPSFFGSFLEDFANDGMMPMLDKSAQIRCKSCNSTFDDIIKSGKLGCPNCYDSFDFKLDPILKRIQGANRHVGRLGKILDNEIKYKEDENKEAQNGEENNKDAKNAKMTQLEKLQEDLKQAVKEERYEDAAKIRDEIKKLEK